MTEVLAARVIDEMVRHGLTVACAESLTGGLVCAALTDVPGSSAVVRGGVVAYATDLKASLLGVDPDLLAERGAVDADVAAEMAEGAARVCHASVGIATTGVAGPAPQDGRAPGTVHIAVWRADAQFVRSLSLVGDRSHIRAGVVRAALELLLGAVTD